jgi:hypothetical protein
MNRPLLTIAMLASAAVAGCSTIETKTAMTTPASGQPKQAGPGDVVMSFQSRRALPNIVGQADIWGRTTNAGGTTVRFIGTHGQQAVFERTDVSVESNATTMTESPMIIPQSTTTNVHGSVGMTPVTGTATSTSYRYIPPRGSSQVSTMQRPVQITLGSGQSVPIQGRTLKVLSVSANSVTYIIQ